MSYESNLIKAVQTGRSMLGLSEEEYRLLIGSVSGGKKSSRELTIRQLREVLEAMRKLGFRPATERQMLKIRALWHCLADEGVVRSDTERSLSAYIFRITKKAANVCKAEDLAKVIETLKKWIGRIENQEARARLESSISDI